MMKPVTKWAERVYETRRIPEYVDLAFRRAIAGKPGPVYLDLPGDVLYPRSTRTRRELAPTCFRVARPSRARCRRSEAIDRIIESFAQQAPDHPLRQRRPVVRSRRCAAALRRCHRHAVLHDAAGARRDSRGSSVRFRASALQRVQGGGFRARRRHAAQLRVLPRRAAALLRGRRSFVRIDIDPVEIARPSSASIIGIVGDARVVLEQLTAAAAAVAPEQYAAWRQTSGGHRGKAGARSTRRARTDQMPIHPLRLCKEIRDFIDRDTILCVDGQEILNYGRQSIPSYRPGHRLNSGPFGTMGVGLPFGVGAKAARPDQQVVVLHGDGSFGLNAMELDTAVAAQAADPRRHQPERRLDGGPEARQAGARSRLHALRPDGAGARLPRRICRAAAKTFVPRWNARRNAVDAGQTAVVNVVTDWRARAGTANFTSYTT